MSMMRLGNLIGSLKGYNPDIEVRYDFVYEVPTTLGSYRGYYEQLALGYCNVDEASKGRAPGDYPTAGLLLAELESALSPAIEEFTVENAEAPVKPKTYRKFTGYKGGNYVMTERTPVWVANYGEAAGTGIESIDSNGYVIILCTRKFEF